MQKAITDQIDQLIMEGAGIQNAYLISRWFKKVAVFLKTTLGENIERDFSNLNSDSEWEQLAMRIGLLQGVVAKGKDSDDKTASKKDERPVQVELRETRKVFIVHGHDEAAKEATARFLEKLDLQPIILHEQASGGRTIIEKFEKYSVDVGFAVVLLTPDDLGAAQQESNKLRSRARQNVVLELGYFLGKLTRNRVCALYKGGVELPSDIQGVIYVEMDNKGAWKAKLAQELVQANCAINLQGLITG